MSDLKDLLLQILLITIPIFIYHNFFLENVRAENKYKDKLIVVMLTGISIILCMSFPIYLSNDSRFDLRGIPLLMGTLYGGYRTGFFLAFLIMGYRTYLGIGLGFYHSIFTLLLVLPVIMWCYRYFKHGDRTTRKHLTIFLSVYYAFVISVLSLSIGLVLEKDFLTLLIFDAIFVLSSCFLIYINENIRENYLLRKELQKTEKLRVLSDLTSAFAHEIRNPMQVNRGFLQLIKQEPIPVHVKNYIEICMNEMDRANVIINDYLSFAKPQTEDLEMIDVSSHIMQVRNILAPYALMQKVEISCDIKENCFILANPQKINQCLINIVKNGIEAMTKGGTLVITCHPQQDRSVRIRIQDEGVGMSGEQMKRLGTLFYTLKEKGTGLGLMVSYRIIQSFDGFIEVSSKLGKGTTFLITFPSVDLQQYKSTS